MMASYSAMLLVHLCVSRTKLRLVAYLYLDLDGAVIIVVTPAPCVTKCRRSEWSRPFLDSDGSRRRPYPVNYEVSKDLGFYSDFGLEDNVVDEEFCYPFGYYGGGLWIVE
jgi:hypothetical protein